MPLARCRRLANTREGDRTEEGARRHDGRKPPALRHRGFEAARGRRLRPRRGLPSGGARRDPRRSSRGACWRKSTGTEDYRVNLLGKGETIKGECTCPAFDDYGFCKHMVATALAANESDHGYEPDGAGALARIRAHLADKPNAVLVAMIVELAERDRGPVPQAGDRLGRRRRRRQDAGGAPRQGDRPGDGHPRLCRVWRGRRLGRAASTKRSTPSRLSIPGATALSSSWPSARSTGSRAQSNPSTIPTANAAPCSSARGTSTSAPPAAPGPTRWRSPATSSSARPGTATERSTARPGSTPTLSAKPDWPNIGGSRPKHGRSCRRSARAAEQKAEGDYRGLSGILDRFAERDGDVEARIALRAKDLSSPWKYLELAEFCLKHKGANEALRWAEEGLWTFEDGPSDARLVLFAADLLMKADRRGEAEAVLKRTFERAPDFNVYLRWRDAGGEAALRPGARGWSSAARRPRPGSPSATPPILASKFSMHEKRFDTAWAMTRKHRVSRAVKEGLARESEADHPREALEVYARARR